MLFHIRNELLFSHNSCLKEIEGVERVAFIFFTATIIVEAVLNHSLCSPVIDYKSLFK